jgi:hypothetical protein
MRKTNKDVLKKVRHDRELRLEHEGKVWTIDAAEWRNETKTRGELRVYRIEGDVTTPLLGQALQAEAESRALGLTMAA